MDDTFFQNFNTELQANIRKDLGLDESWFYRDMPWVKDEFWEEFLKLVSDDKIRIIAMSTRNDWKDGPYHHAQIMYNPENIRKFQEAKIIAV